MPSHLYSLFKCFIVIALISVLCTAYAYHVNSKRQNDDPKKRHYHPLAVLFAPLTFPVFIILYTLLLLLKVVLFGMFIVLFTFALIFLRKPIILEGLKKIALKIGNRLLDANMLLVRIFVRPLVGPSGSV